MAKDKGQKNIIEKIRTSLWQMHDAVTNIPKPSAAYNGQSLFFQVGGTGSLLVGRWRTRALGCSVPTQASEIPAGGRYDREGHVDASLRTAPGGSATLPWAQEDTLLLVNISKTATRKIDSISLSAKKKKKKQIRTTERLDAIVLAMSC